MRRAPRWLWTKATALAVVGFAVSLIGLIGGAMWLAPADREVESVSTEIANQSARARLIRAATSFADTVEHMQGLVFTVPIRRDLPDDVRAAMGELFRRSIDHGRNGFRAYLAEVALTGVTDFAAASRQYETLAAAEQADFKIETFRAVNAYEADFAMAMVKAEGEAAIRAITLQNTRREAKAAAARRHLTLTLVALAGSVIVLVATLGGGGAPTAPQPGATRALAAALKRLQTGEARG